MGGLRIPSVIAIVVVKIISRNVHLPNASVSAD